MAMIYDIPYTCTNDMMMIYWLVVEPYSSERYEFVNRGDEIPKMFQTTNQYRWKSTQKMFWNHQPDTYKIIKIIEDPHVE